MQALLLFVLASIASPSFARVTPNSSLEFLRNCNEDVTCELKLFRELSNTFRPSGEETELSDYILAIKETSATNIWRQKLESFKDAAGNLLIRVPATGKYKKATKPVYFALQSHMDMVLAYVDARPGEDVRPYFKDGIKIEEKDGWLQSEGNRTTLGADNGIGVATALRYLIDISIEHPPLELIFTVKEEVGLAGAFDSNLPILSKKMLCLDGMTPEPGQIIAGAQGAIRNRVQLTPVNMQANLGAATSLIQITVTKLTGGHSGNDIHKTVLNSVKGFGEIVRYLTTLGVPAGLKKLTVGESEIYNKIPNAFHAELVIARDQLNDELLLKIDTQVRTIIARNAEDLASAMVDVRSVLPTEESYVSLNYEFTHKLIASIESARNGLVDPDINFFNSIFTSNNLAFMNTKLDPDGKTILVELGYMTRGFKQERINDVANEVSASFRSNSSLAGSRVETVNSYPPWLEPDSSTLLQETLTKSGYFTKKFFITGGLEPSAFKSKIPDLEVVALGPLIQKAHTVKERLKLDTIGPVVVGVRKIIQLQK